ncbi:Exosome complex component-like protein [Emericellopsis cladophorae]|uniref:Ribosomal RNA-processing protein 42 n=1 Tax=Emericellopsis cladophorae TaxID=2686198 RepID=A0A9Q0BC17_9HYPO|nr:Exosome complex component-like protein [Emericellopsis cladophorae]KAI6780362.1 Exosome complex component-like protein [Emericellopsis cladophorae]
MATSQVLLSPAELAYIHSSLSLRPPIRSDGRTSTQFRPLTAETGVLPGTNGSARVCFSDGTEAIVGVKAEIERTRADNEQEDQDDGAAQRQVRGDWVEIAVEIPGLRDDDASTVFLGEMLREALLGDGDFARKLWINRRFHWRLYLDILLISPPLSYPLPLLSLTTHLALLATRLPRLKSEGDEDPMFDDDWQASQFLYSQNESARPPITLLVVAIGDNVIFDPSKEELAVAESALAVSVAAAASEKVSQDQGRKLKLVSVRMVDPPSRLTPPGVPNGTSSGTGAAPAGKEGESVEGVWKAPVGGTKFAILDGIIQAVLEKGGVADEVLDGLKGVELA